MAFGVSATLPNSVTASTVSRSYIIRPHLLGNQVVGELRIGAGVACYRDGVVGPPSYLVADIGKRGVPLTTSDARLLREQYSHIAPKTLRFVYLPKMRPHYVVVFNAPLDKLCDPMQPPFKTFTGPCREYYSPLEGMNATSPANGC